MADRSNQTSRPWLPGRSDRKSLLKRRLAEAADADWSRLRDYAVRRSIDASWAADIVENLVEGLAAKQEARPASRRIRHPGRYLASAFARAVNRLRVKEERVKYVESIAELERFAAAGAGDRPQELDREILLKKLFALMDPSTRRTCWARLHGHSWKEIAQMQGVSVNTAIKAYARGLKRVRELTGKSRKVAEP
jgi:DNA-directed RNA polymerase specialized sigma24 family protein